MAEPTLDKLTFTLSSDGTYYTVKALNKTISGEVVIPAEYEGKPVKEIGNYAFDNCSALTSINIPNSVNLIGNYAFQICSALTTINIPNSVTLIKNGIFNGCSALTSIVIPNSVTSIGFEAFGACSALTSIVIPNSVTSIGSSAFYWCTALKSVIIKGKPTITDDYGVVFESTTNLKKIYVLEGNGYSPTDTISGKPIRILPKSVCIMHRVNVEKMTLL